MPRNPDKFIGPSRDLARAIAGHDRPLTFVLGAGASLSSGAPSTPKVHERLHEATEGRFHGHVREHIHELSRQEVRDHLRPLFVDVLPDVGYRMLAALSRTRRINVVSLNWDDAVRKACAACNVPFYELDPLREGATQTVEELPPEIGVFEVHVHGMLDDDARYGVMDTMPNQPKIWDSIAPLLNHDTIICGASLTDLDVADVLERVSNSDRDGAAVWLFSRPGGDERLAAIPSSWRQVEAQEVDFDDLMILLVEEVMAVKGMPESRWDELTRRQANLALPRAEDLVELAPHVRRRALDAQVAGLVAPPYSGKSVGAVRLAHLRRLIDGVQEPLRVSLDAQDSPAALAISVAKGDVVAVIDDPFGNNLPETNPRVRDFLIALCETDGGYVAVSSPVTNWEAEAGPLLRDHPGLYVATRNPDEWYERSRLHRFAAGRKHPIAAVNRIAKEEISTPPEVLEVGRSGHSVDTGRMVADKHRALENQPTLALLCSIARLQEGAEAPIADAELTALIEAEPESVPGYEAFLRRQALGTEGFWTLNHHTSAAAIDRYLHAHLAEVAEQLKEAKVVPPRIERCLATWALANGVEMPGIGIDVPDELEPADWIARRLGSDPSDEELAAIDLRPKDEWATVELAYEIVRIWDSISSLPSGRRLLTELRQRPMGLYSLLEGCLYFGLGPTDELWTRLTDRVYDLPDEPERRFEMLLILDAVLWRQPGYPQLLEWAHTSFERMRPDTEEFALVRFAAGYHSAGLAGLNIESALQADSMLTWSIEQARVAARLVAWHFAHQSRSRVLLHRRSNIDKAWLCQSLGQDPVDEGNLEPKLRLIDSLSTFPETAGWGFHLACNLGVIPGGLDLQSENPHATAQRALEQSLPGDSGVISAAIAYRSADLFARTLVERFREPGEAERLLAAMGEGIEVAGGLFVAPPRFRFVADPEAVHRSFDLRFGGLDAALPRQPIALQTGLWEAAGEVVKDRSQEVRKRISGLIEQVGRGDFRAVLIPSARGPEQVDPFTAAVLAMVENEALNDDGTLI
jgi:hypothetical protein